MDPFEQLIYDRFSQAILGWDTERDPDIYVISLLYDSYWITLGTRPDVSVQGEIQLSYNTGATVAADIAQGADAREAEWDPGYWQSGPSATVPLRFDSDATFPAEEFALRDAWCASLGLKRDEHGDYDEWELYEAIRGTCGRVAQALHRDGVIRNKIGRSIPVVIHGIEVIEQDAEATREANPPGLSREAEESLLGRDYGDINSYNELVKEIQERPVPEQVLFWRDVWLDLVLDRPSATATRLKQWKRSQYDIQPNLTALGPPIVPALVPVVEEYAFQEQYLRFGAPDGAWTPESNIIQGAVTVMMEVGVASDEDSERLYAVVSRLFQESIGKNWIGTNLSGLASALHTLRPSRFPSPQIGGSNNKLLNYREFGFLDPMNN